MLASTEAVSVPADVVEPAILAEGSGAVELVDEELRVRLFMLDVLKDLSVVNVENVLNSVDDVDELRAMEDSQIGHCKAEQLMLSGPYSLRG